MVEYENPYQDKIDKDEKNLVKLKAGTANQQLINAAYLGARQESSEVMTWMNAAESGITSFTKAIGESRKIKQAKLDEMNGKIDDQIETLSAAGYSLGKNYYAKANEYTKKLRERYLAEEGNAEAQNLIKMELNVASQNIGATKQTIEQIATAWESDDIEKLALSEDEQKIMNIAMDPNGAHAVWIEGENTFGWRDPDDHTKIYTLKQIQDIQNLASKDYVAKEANIKYEQQMVSDGVKYRTDGTGAGFDNIKQMHANKTAITKDNIRFFINGDFTGDGTPSFKDEVINHPEWDNKIFEHLTENALETYDTDNDGDVDINDFAGASRALQMEKVYNAITTPGTKENPQPGYDFDVTQGLIAEYMTLRQKKAFYEGSKLDANGNPMLTPKDYASTVNNDNFRDKDFAAAGGNIGYMKSLGWQKIEQFEGTGKNKEPFNPRQYKWEINPMSSFTSKKRKYDKKEE